MISRKEWQRRFPGMVNSKQLYNQYKDNMFNTINVPSIDCFGGIGVTTVSLASCNEAPQVKMPCQKGNNPMYVDNDKHIESSKINYLADRANSVFYKVADKLPRQFHLTDDVTPSNPTEAVERIKAGKYTIDTEKKRFYCWTDGLRWRDPAAVADEAGYEAANAALKVAYQDTKDTIAIGTPAEGLAAVKALDAWTPTVGTA